MEKWLTFIRMSVYSYGTACVTFAINFYLAKYLSKEVYGDYGFALVWATFVTTLVAFGSDRTLVRDLVQSESPSVEMVDSLILRLIVFCAIVPVIVILILYEFPSSIGLLLVSSCFGFIQAMRLKAWFDVKMWMDKFSLILLLEKLVVALTLITLTAVILKSGAIGMMFLFLFVTVFCWYGQVVYVRKELSFGGRFSLVRRLKKLAQGSYLVAFAGIGNLAISHYNQVFLYSHTGAEELAVYALAFQMVLIIQIFQRQVCSFLTPWMVRVSVDDLVSGSQKIGVAILISLAASGLCVILVRPIVFWIIDEFLAGKYAAAKPVMDFLFIWLALFGPGLLVNQMLINAHRNKVIIVCTITSGMLSILLGLVLVPSEGAVGVAKTLLYSHSVSILIQAWFVVGIIKNRNIKL